MGFNPFKAFQESFEDDLLLNLATGGQFAVAETIAGGAGAAADSVLSKDNSATPQNLLDLGQTEEETAALREEKERLRRERQPGRRQTLLSLNTQNANNLLKGF